MPTAPSRPRTPEDEDALTPLPPPVDPVEVDAPETVEAASGPDLGARRARVRQMVDEQAAKQFGEAHPFLPQGWQQPTPQRVYDRAEREVEELDRDRAMRSRAQEVAARRGQIAQQKAVNAEREAKFRGTGQKFYTDAYGNMQPVIEAGTGRALYETTDWEDSQHPKTGLPALMKRDRYGQRQFKAPPLALSSDPHDEFLYAKNKDGTSVPYMRAEEAAKSPDVSLARRGLQHISRRNLAARREALGPVNEARQRVLLEFQTAESELGRLKAEQDEVLRASGAITPEMTGQTEGGVFGIGAQPTPAAQQAQTQQKALQDQALGISARITELEAATKPGGELHQKKTLAELGIKVTAAELSRDSHLDQEKEILARLADEGGSPESDPTYLANHEALENAAQAAQAAKVEMDRWKGLMARKAQQVPPPVQAEAQPKETHLKNAFAQGAVGGIGAVAKGLEVAGYNMPPTDEYGRYYDAEQGADYERRMALPAAQQMAEIQQGTAYQWGSAVQAAAAELYPTSPEAQKGFLEHLAGSAGGFLPLIASGPAAPLTMGLQATGDEMEHIYQDRVAKGASPDAAADFAMKRAVMSGVVQAALFEVLPRPLHKLADKAIVDKLAKGALTKILAERISQGAQGTVLGGATTVVGNVTADRPVTQGAGAGAAGLGVLQAVTGGYGRGARAEPEGPKGEAKAPPEQPPPESAPKAETPPPAPDPARLDRIAKAAEEAANMTPEEAEAHFQRLLADENKTQTEAPAEAPERASVRGTPESPEAPAPVGRAAEQPRDRAADVETGKGEPVAAAAEPARGELSSPGSGDGGEAARETGSPEPVAEAPAPAGPAVAHFGGEDYTRTNGKWASASGKPALPQVAKLLDARMPTLDVEFAETARTPEQDFIRAEGESSRPSTVDAVQQMREKYGAQKLRDAYQKYEASYGREKSKSDGANGSGFALFLRNAAMGDERALAALAESAPEAKAVAENKPAPALLNEPTPGTALPKNARITIQASENGIPGYEQIDLIREDGQSAGSYSPEQLRTQGYDVPDLKGLKTGQYGADLGAVKAEATKRPVRTDYATPEEFKAAIGEWQDAKNEREGPAVLRPTDKIAAALPTRTIESIKAERAKRVATPKRVRVAGEDYDVVRANPDGTLKLRSEGGEFDTALGEKWTPLAEKAAPDTSSADVSKVSRDEFIRRELDSKLAVRKIALLEAENAIRTKWTPPKPLPVGASKIQALLAADRLSPEARKLRAQYEIAKRNVDADTRTDAETAGAVYDRLKGNAVAPAAPAPKAAEVASSESGAIPSVAEEVTSKAGDSGIVARSKARERADVDSGTSFNEWRIRKITALDYEKFEAIRNKASIGDYIVERRNVRTESGKPDAIGEWYAMDAGRTKADALESSWESSLSDADSLSPVHKEVADFIKDKSERTSAASKEMRSVEQQLSSWPEEAKAEYVSALKAEKLYTAASKNEAPPDKIRAIKERIKAKYDALKIEHEARYKSAKDADRNAREMTLQRWRKSRVEPETKSIAAKLPEVSTPEVVTGEAINKNWTAFGPESQSLGVPRAEMPQIKSEARGALVNFLKARGIDAKAGVVMPSKLKPTQAEFSPDKVQKAREHTGSDRPILISADGHVVDGHHQWMAALDDTTTPMPVIRLNAPIEKVLAEMKDFPSTESATGIKTAAKEVTPSPKATLPLSDRAIAALQKAKIHKPGMVRSADPFTLAYDGAIDLAILGIRAGRKAAEVIKLAIDRFKARYPKHTPEELARVETAVREAITEPPTPPTDGSKKKSLLPESLKDAGAPVDSIEYAVRHQEARKAEASAIISKEGREKAEDMMVKSDLPGDTRVAIGGQLINDRMLALSEAKPEDVARISRDIQRITAKMQPELATEAGQQISMFGGIYKDVRVAAATEYIRSETKKRVDAMGGEDIQKAAQEAADAFNKTTDPKTRDAAIEKLKEKYTTKPVRKSLDQLKRVEVTKHLNGLGVLTRDDMIEVAGNALGLPGISAQKLKHLAGLADKINAATNHAERSRAELDLAAALNIYKGVEAMDVASSVLTANILSGYTTQLANIEGNALNMLGQLASTAAVNPTKLAALTRGFLDGLPLAKDQAKSIWKTGRGTRDFQDKTAGAGSVLSTVDFSRDFPAISKPVGAVATVGARALDHVFRFMKAADAVFYYPAREAYARLVATKLLEGDYKGAELGKKVSELLHTTPEAFEAARKQAAAEGYEGIDLGRRVADIIEERRADGNKGANVVKESERFAAESTFTNEPEGLAGVAYHALKYAVQEARVGKVPILKPWVMFLKTPANVFNTTLNYTPIGAVRAHFGMRGAGFRNAPWRNFTKDERHRLYLQSVVGTAIMGGLLARILNKGDVDLSAQGPEDAAKRGQLRSAGWSPYSVKVGDKWISYKDSPLLVPLSIVGHVADSIKYNKPQKDVSLEQRVAEAVASSPQTIFQTSMLTGLADLMGSLSGKGGPAGVTRTLGSLPANLVVPYNRLLQQIDQSFDNKTYDNPPVVGTLPFVRRMGEPLTDVQGRPQTYSPMQRFGSTESHDQVDTLLRDKKVFIPDVGRDVKLGNATMTDEQRDAYRRISGQRIRVRLAAIAPRLRAMSQEDAQDEITSIAREEREKVKPLVRAGVGVRR